MGSNTDVDTTLQQVATEFGTPAYVYFASRIEERVALLQKAFDQKFALSFAVKSNPNPELLGWLGNHIDFLDVSSIGELRLSLRAGWGAEHLSFTGPGKRGFELREAMHAGLGELVVESVSEAKKADQIAGSMGRVQDVLIRIAPDWVPKGFGDQMAGKPSPFGVDIEEIHQELPIILGLKSLRVIGLHIYSGTQCLKPDAIRDNYHQFIKIFRTICDGFDLSPQKLIFGSGLGIPYHDADKELDLQVVAASISTELEGLMQEPRFQKTKLVLELGRYLVGPAGYFLTKVVSVKQSRGRRIGICDGGMNNHLPASGHFGMVIHRNYVMHKVGGGGPGEKINLVGPLCTSIDRVANDITLPQVNEGDLIAVHNSGAYGLSASPIHFISHKLPFEILVEGADMRDVSRNLGDLEP